MSVTYEHFASRTPGVLVVDASPRVRALLGQRLRNHGFAVWRAAGGLEAVEVYRRNPGIDLVLIDADMAGMDGPRTLAALRRLDAGVRCCFLAGEPRDRHLAGRSPELGAVPVLRKSLGLVELDRIVTELLLPVETGEWASPPLAG